jgi:site-specific DNA-methyltransferase (cytosine-N4-specific)
MCGSGTAAVESLVAGCRAIALDRNPLSTFITRTKCAVLAIKPDILISAYEQIRARLLSSYLRKNSRLEYFRSLPERDQMYLTDWFSEQVLMDLDTIAVQINEVEKSEIRDLMKIALSNILRKVSWQKDDDLRVRREIRLDAEIDPIREYLEELGRSVRLLIAFLYRIDRNKIGSFDIRDGDARSLETELRDCVGKVDAVITSPPYATALPYLDTDRLSLCYLGLLSRPMHRNRDLEMIGNREITDKCRQVYWQEFRKNKDVLPQSVSELIEGIDRRNSTHPTGFRRRNLAALLARYFSDIKKVIGGIKRVLRPKGFACLVIGSNHTIAGGERVDINTPLLISDIAKGAGLDLCSRIPMEMLVSRDIFRRNAGVSEEIILLRKRSSP